jgi:hypothetical protein
MRAWQPECRVNENPQIGHQLLLNHRQQRSALQLKQPGLFISFKIIFLVENKLTLLHMKFFSGFELYFQNLTTVKRTIIVQYRRKGNLSSSLEMPQMGTMINPACSCMQLCHNLFLSWGRNSL